MNPHRHIATWLGMILGACFALLLNAHAQGNDKAGQMTEEFHHVYPLSANGRLALENINGAVHMTAWDRDEVKVDAVKYSRVKERLDEARIAVDAEPNSISIRTEYPKYGHLNSNGTDNPASVEYTLMVPKGAHPDEIKLINGKIEIRHNSDGRALSPAKDSGGNDRDRDDI